ncbi:MAG: gamma-glutamyl-gamma-aminobutyrate hydrolase family protein [Solirubrobacterales bacterium]
MIDDSVEPRTRRPANPLIGVTTSEVRKAETVSPTPEGEPPRHEMALGLTYMRAVELAGGIPVVIPPLGTDLIGPLLGRLDGICLSGGPDIHPDSYGQDPHEMLGPTEPDLDRFELNIAHWADMRGLPILAICRGMQALNISRGGTLIQHIPDRWLDVEHRQKMPGQTASHRVDLAPDARLSEIFGSNVIAVNSFHHQAVDRIGENLEPSGWAPDGAIEAVEDRSRPFLIGVQWHAELMVDQPDHLGVFESFTDASREFGKYRLTGAAA